MRIAQSLTRGTRRRRCHVSMRPSNFFITAPRLPNLSMSFPILLPPLRLGLVFFDAADERALRAIIDWASSSQLPWVVCHEAPYHALLMARGTRRDDAPDQAMFRLGAEAERAARDAHGDAMPPMALRKPLQPMHLRIVLEMAAASLIPDYIEAVSPQTRPRVAAHVAERIAPKITPEPLLRPGVYNWR